MASWRRGAWRIPPSRVFPPLPLLPLPLFLLLLLASSLMARGIAAEPLEPLPRTTPAVPGEEGLAGLTPEQRLQRHLADLAHAHALRIDVLRRALAEQPRADLSTSADPALVGPRRTRDQAWADLRTALDDYVSRAPRAKTDPLDTGNARAQASQQAPLSNANRLLVAECYRDLVADPAGSDQDVADGLAAVAAIDIDQLPEGDRPRALYLAAFFQAESARRGAEPQRAASAAQARATAATLKQDHPASDLAGMVDLLLTGLPDGP